MHLRRAVAQQRRYSVKVSYLKMWIGDKGLDIFKGLTFADPGDAAKLKVVVQKFEEYCVP